jgi:hypothetical protein
VLEAEPGERLKRTWRTVAERTLINLQKATDRRLR